MEGHLFPWVSRLLLVFTLTVAQQMTLKVSDLPVLTPEEVVKRYYLALKEGDFAQAYGYISKNMRAGKSRVEWVRQISKLFKSGKVEIEEVSVSLDSISGREAVVKSQVVSKDLFNRKGIIEYNREHLIREDGHWKLDRTELIRSIIKE